MPTYEYRCKECTTEFERYKFIGGMNSEADKVTGEVFFFINGEKVNKEKYEEYGDTLKGVACPVCYSTNIIRVFSPISMVYNDNALPGRGLSIVDKRHQDGIYGPREIRQGQEASREMKEQGRKDALKMAQKDEEHIRKTYRQVSEKEAKQILKDPKRKQEVAIINESASNT